MSETPPTPSWRMFGSPSRYIQGPGVLDTLGAVIVKGHHHGAVLVDSALFHSLSPRLLKSLSESNLEAAVIAVSGEVTAERIESLAEQTRTLSPSVIIAVGGGKTLDTGKGVALSLQLPIVTVPTIASNDGPTSRLVAQYNETHLLIATPQMALNPETVVVDTTLIAQAPSFFLRAGIGDALSKRYEARACRRGNGVTPNGTRPLEVASYIADACYETILASSSQALKDVEERKVSAEVERIVEAVILLSGLAFENGGLSLAHSATRGLMAIDGASSRLHGTQVAYGLLMQLQHEGDFDSLHELFDLYAEIGLPRKLSDLDASKTDETVAAIVKATLSAPHMANCTPTPTPNSLTEAIRALEAA